jgi:hypothetical protein
MPKREVCALSNLFSLDRIIIFYLPKTIGHDLAPKIQAQFLAEEARISTEKISVYGESLGECA